MEQLDQLLDQVGFSGAGGGGGGAAVGSTAQVFMLEELVEQVQLIFNYRLCSNLCRRWRRWTQIVEYTIRNWNRWTGGTGGAGGNGSANYNGAGTAGTVNTGGGGGGGGTTWPGVFLLQLQDRADQV
jgi:hypothetical protein